jgi:hypothetical protein
VAIGVLLMVLRVVIPLIGIVTGYRHWCHSWVQAQHSRLGSQVIERCRIRVVYDVSYLVSPRFSIGRLGDVWKLKRLMELTAILFVLRARGLLVVVVEWCNSQQLNRADRQIASRQEKNCCGSHKTKVWIMVEDSKPEERQFVCAYKICSLKFSRIGSNQAVKFFDDSVIQKRPTIGWRKKESNVMSFDTVNEWMG